jgi:hypothetical protein
MIERDLDVPPGVDAVRVSGTVTRRDFEDVVGPLLDAAVREGRRLRILSVIDGSFSGMTPGAVVEDLRAGVVVLRHLAGCAVVSDLSWIRSTIRFATFFLPGRFRVFPEAERDAALRWLADLPSALADARLRADDGVVVVEIDQPLRREDIDLAAGVAGTLLHPEVRRFTDLDDAVRWAAATPVRVG